MYSSPIASPRSSSPGSNLGRLTILTFLAMALATGCVVSYALGQDANWDLLNYHLYNPFALLTHRLSVDLMPAGLQTFFNPLLDVPYYLLSRKVGPQELAALQGTYYGVTIFLVFAINVQVFGWRTSLGSSIAVAASLIGVTGSALISQVGTTFNEVQVAALVLAGVLLIVRCLNLSEHGGRLAPSLAGAGALMGCAAGLKLTAALYAPAAVIAVLVATRFGRPGFVGVVGLSVCWLLAFAAFFGWWGWHVYGLVGNPVFPMLNQVFRSEWYPPISFLDARMIPTTLLRALLFPFEWAKGGSMIVMEVTFRDARFAAAWVAAAVLVLVSVISGVRSAVARRDGPPNSGVAFGPSAAFVLTFAAIAYGIWLVLFSLLRYAIPLEALTGTIIGLALWRLSQDSRLRRLVSWRVAAGAGATCAVVLACTTRYPDWGRVAYGAKPFEVQAPHLPDGALVIVAGSTLSYVLPFLNPRASFVGVTHTTVEARQHRLFAETKRRIASHAGPVYMLIRPETVYVKGTLDELGVSAKNDECAPVRSNLEPSASLFLCVALRRT